MRIGGLPSDTSVDTDKGYVLYTEDGVHVNKVSVKNFRSAGGVGLKYWKETENTLYRTQHNEGQWMFNDFFVVPGGAEMIVGFRTWDFRDGGADDDKSDPILVGHTDIDPITGDIYTYTTEEPGPEVLWLAEGTKGEGFTCPQKYYIFKRLSNKPVMGGMLWYKFWGDPNTSRKPNVDLNYNLPGWLLMSTDPEDLAYQLIEREAFSYGDYPSEIQERIDNGFFRPDFAEERVIATIYPLEQTFTHPESGAVFYINGMPSPDIFEFGVGLNRDYKCYYSFTATEGNDQSLHPYFGTPELYYSFGSSYYSMPDDARGPSYTTYPATGNYMSSRLNWVGYDIYDPVGNQNKFQGYKLKNVKFDSYAWHKTWRGAKNGGLQLADISAANCYHYPLAYLGAVWNHSGFAYSGDNGGHGRDAITYIFHDGEIEKPDGYFTYMATGFADSGMTFYSGEMSEYHDEADLSDVNFNVDRKGNISGKSLAANGQILSDQTPIISDIEPLLTEGTRIANMSKAGLLGIIGLFAPDSSGGESGFITEEIWANQYTSGSQTQVSTITFTKNPGDYDILMIDFRQYGSPTRSYKRFIFMACASLMPSIAYFDCVGSDRNNYVGFQGKIKSGTYTYINMRYGGSAFIKRIVGIKLSRSES